MDTILVITEPHDHSTHQIVKWLRKISSGEIVISTYFHHDHITDFYLSLDSDGLQTEFMGRSGHFLSSKITDHIIYRRGAIFFQNSINRGTAKWSHLNKEANVISDFLFHRFDRKSLFGGRLELHQNKLKQLDLAQQCGLKIPRTIVTSSAKKLKKYFMDKGINEVICKALSDGIIKEKDSSKIFFTNYVDLHHLKQTVRFFPTLFQEKIRKVFEVRSFFFNNEFYCTAIFSQNNPQTQVDFRRYSIDVPNRVIPFVLPEEIELKLIQLSHKLGLTTGSIDLAFDGEKFVFFEINPVGQFDQVTRPANYYLYKRLAKHIYEKYKTKVK